MSNKSLSSKLPHYCENCLVQNDLILSKHRIHPGRDGGKYTLSNTIRLCLNCHRLADLGVLLADRLQMIVDQRDAAS